MKKRALGMMMALIMIIQSQAVFASDRVDVKYIATSGSAMDVDLFGQVDAPIISVIMPTQVKFAVIPEAEEWNKVLSPDFSVRNTGNVMLDVSITKARVKTAGVEFTNKTPAYVNTVKQVRLAVAPKSNYADVNSINKFLLSNEVSDTSPITLTKDLDYAVNNDAATYQIYGDVSTGWSHNETFSITAVFKVAIK